MSYIHFTEDQKRRANSTDLAELLRRRGEKLLRSGPEFRLERDHSVTVRGNEWYDHAAGKGGGPVSFFQKFYGMSYPEAMSLLLNGEQGATYTPAPRREELPKPFRLPEANPDMRRVYAYLMRRRCVSREVISAFVKARLIYEDAKYHNAVFVGKDEQGVPRHAHRRGTNSEGKSFRANVEDSRPQYSFHWSGPGDRLYVFEAPIDLLSFLTRYPKDWQEDSYVALCGTSEHAMLWMLEQHPQLQEVGLCLDNDKAGLQAAERLTGILREKGYDQVQHFLPTMGKDWNEALQALTHEQENGPVRQLAGPVLC